MANRPDFTLKETNGGINWGYCVPPSTVKSQVDYIVTIVTSALPRSGTR
jgi:hypothetical protein